MSPEIESRPAGNRAAAESDRGITAEFTVRPPTLGPTACRILTRSDGPWPTLDAWLAAWNRRTELARAASHLVCVALDGACTSDDVQAAIDRLLPLLKAVGG